MKKKDLWSDPFDAVRAAPVRQASRPVEQEYVEVPYTDRRTGAQYMVREPGPPKPQGDFRVDPRVAESRYRSVMGLSEAQNDRRPQELNEDEPERMPNALEIETKARRRAMGDAKRENMLRATSERPEEHSDFVDRGTHIEDPSGKIHERKYNTIGPFGTEEQRGPAPAAKAMPEATTIVAAHPEVPVAAPTEAPAPDAFQERLNKKYGLQVLLTEAYRGLFGSGVADHIMTRSQVADRRPGFERPTVSHVIMDLGLMKPWNAPRVGPANSDRPVKTDATALAVGHRAIETILAKKTAPEILDLPRAEKDDLAVALGRTILNAMSVLPNRTDRPDAVDIQTKWRDEIQAVVASAVDPQILKGLVAPEALADRPRVDPTTVVRTSGAAPTAGVLVDRQPSVAPDRPVSAAVAVTRPILGDFGALGRTRKRDMFNMAADEKPLAREEAPDRPSIGSSHGLAGASHTGRIAPARIEMNSRDSYMAGPFALH